MLQTSWNRCWKTIGATSDGHAVMARLIAAYNEPHRRYHTGQHLLECLTLFEEHIGLAAEPAEVELALWFHDAVYNVRAVDNEARSADWAARELALAGVPTARVDRVTEHILATRHSALPQGQDQMLLVDIDLAILGSAPPRFAEYERQIREEYAWVPGFLFRRRRRNVLLDFQRRNPIYNIEALREALENQARLNLDCSLRKLGVS